MMRGAREIGSEYLLELRTERMKADCLSGNMKSAFASVK